MSDQIPKAVTQQEDSWKVIKDVIRNIIDGQPKKVNSFFGKDNDLVLCTVQSADDAMKAYGKGTSSLLRF